MFNSLLAFFFWKSCTFSSFKRFLFKIYKLIQDLLSGIINHCNSILILYITWRAFSLVCFLSVFFFFFLLLFFFSFGIFLDRQLVIWPFPKTNKKKGMLHFFKRDWNRKWYSYLYQYTMSFPDRYWLHTLLVKP